MIKYYLDLYTLDKKGNIRVYKSHVKYEEKTDSYNIITESGLLTGSLTQHVKKIRIGKGNKTPEEQATNEGQSKWNAKLDDGYKSYDMLIAKLNQGNYEQPVKELFNDLSILYNTNKDWHELPMLAEPIKKVKKMPLFVYAQPKLNGVRCITKTYKGEILLLSRGGKYYDLPHITNGLKAIFDKYPNIKLDGEIYKHGVPLGKITGAVARKSVDMFSQPTWLEYHIYDMVSIFYEQDKRINRLEILQEVEHSSSINFVETELISSSEASLKIFHDKQIELDYEGAIFRNPEGKYHIGFRDKDLIKMKNFIDEEFEIIGCNIDKSKSIGDSFTFKLQNNIDTQTFNARPRGSRKDKERWYVSIEDIIGKKATVRYQERTEYNLPHQAHVVVIRDYE